MMRTLFAALLSVMLALPAAACGKKGNLRTPSQIKYDAQKKQSRDEKAARETAQQNEAAEQKEQDEVLVPQQPAPEPQQEPQVMPGLK